jgi:hypothetical protein
MAPSQALPSGEICPGGSYPSQLSHLLAAALVHHFGSAAKISGFPIHPTPTVFNSYPSDSYFIYFKPFAALDIRSDASATDTYGFIPLNPHRDIVIY